ncbi:hypothetical protein CPB84DRAFT_1685882 [Gymnopilus junonius]|uniref:Nephrocystin 3-like N-terminal domain-containing protein n=1 Tax=Gymnopilus junonius TaxID=109634 RepID=A0A9P5NEZ6_GYMJU|nr:hypothetical protein CPB84DRAFT_1685882 [Gymnopilus junonius]
MWLYGPARAGKSSIAHSIAELCEQWGTSVASFFLVEREPPITSLAYLLGISIRKLATRITEVFANDSR